MHSRSQPVVTASPIKGRIPDIYIVVATDHNEAEYHARFRYFFQAQEHADRAGRHFIRFEYEYRDPANG